MGYDLCDGTPDDENLVIPVGTAILVEMTNGIIARLVAASSTCIFTSRVN